MRRKRLRFECEPVADESAVGAFTAACHRHRLRSIASGLEGGGIRLSRPGSIQVAPPATLDAAAHVMRVDPGKLRAVAFTATERRDRVALGDLVMPRVAFDWERRRIGPITLRGRPHHRVAWLNLLLPYCPESLELLVDACPECGPLGWRYTRGVAACEECGSTVPPSDQASLETEFADDYRHFADLVSRDTAATPAPVRRLPANLHLFSRTALVGVLLRAGIVHAELGITPAATGPRS